MFMLKTVNRNALYALRPLGLALLMKEPMPNGVDRVRVERTNDMPSTCAVGV